MARSGAALESEILVLADPPIGGKPAIGVPMCRGNWPGLWEGPAMGCAIWLSGTTCWARRRVLENVV